MSAPAKKCTLILQDGTRWEGDAFGAEVSVSGEAVFQTGMVGYPEALTDPSYKRQILVITFPLVGNYGVPDENVLDDLGIIKYLESNKVHVAALVVATLSKDYSHWRAVKSLSEWLKEQGIPGITGVDTRALTKNLREKGCTLAKLVMDGVSESSVPMVDPNKMNLVAEVSIKEPKVYNKGAAVKITMVDCGMKLNQLRCMCKRGAEVTVVPWDFDFVAAYDSWDGLFISNGPGDPTMAAKTITYLRTMLTDMSSGKKKVKPIFGICLGHQLLSLAAGCDTYKLPYGNRGHNQPCMLVGTEHCFITSQNHGFAVDETRMPEKWVPLFRNANDQTNEGVVHETLPFFSVQFHPEARAGPEDTEGLFDVFITGAKELKAGNTFELRKAISDKTTEIIGKDPSTVELFGRPRKVLILGSGGLSIGQAGEFDYSGSQAIKALKEEGIQTVLINPNVATVQTAKGLADKVYFLPVTPEYVIQVLKAERPDGILLSFGGQTALNCGIQLHMKGILEQYSCRVMGTQVETIIATEDREIFNAKLAEINECTAPSMSADSPAEAEEAALKVGFPVIVRAAYALGGLGSGFAYNMDELRALVSVSFSHSPQVLVEKSLRGWKEVEYEVVRDAWGNCITVCNMENFDPLGIHTGESIVVAPSMTLDNEDYNMLRNTAVKVVRHLGVVGECNIQYALDPFSAAYFIIEVNARLSRSSALASKATGYPLAYVAAKLSLDYSLPQLRNSVTGKTTACFEPSLDYLAVKLPRWDLKKFPKVSNKIGSAMKSVGEVMAIGRRFEEAIQKGLRMVDGHEGFVPGIIAASEDEIRDATDQRILSIATAFGDGWELEKIRSLSNIDPWFLNRLKDINDFNAVLETYKDKKVSYDDMMHAKQLGFSDKVIARLSESSELAVRSHRKALKITPVVKQIDTVSAEYPACTNYLYLTYNGKFDDIEPSSNSVFVLGSGVYRIGSSVEFDWCSVACLREMRKLGHQTIVLNCNPETVSTDYDESERLFFDEISFEVVMDIYEREAPLGVVLSVGGQAANNIAMDLFHQNVRVLGTSPEMIDNAENRYKFSRMLDKLGIDQPQWKELSNIQAAKDFCNRVTYPCLIRPSYVLSGAAMNVAHSDQDLESYLGHAVAVSKDYPVVISKFIENAKEIEVDAVAKDGIVVACVISEHVENAGVHSGDATIVSPAQDLTPQTLEGVRDIMFAVAQALFISGPFNMQLIAKDDTLKVIECNVRASRSFPFVSKCLDLPLIPIAARIFMGVSEGVPTKLSVGSSTCVGVKVAQFSFNRLPGSDPTVGVDMMSTGEVACFGETRQEAYFKALLATGFKAPPNNKPILLSIGTYRSKTDFLPYVRMLVDMEYRLFGSKGTADYYMENGIDITPMELPTDAEGGSQVNLKDCQFGLIINIPAKSRFRRPASFNSQGYLTRTQAMLHAVPLITDIKCARLFVEAISQYGLSPPVRPQIDCRTAHRVATLPGLIDLHVHVRDPGATHKEDWASCTAAALAGGITMICAMPNTTPAVTDAPTLQKIRTRAAAMSRCDFGALIGATMGNAKQLKNIEGAIAMCMELDHATTADLQIDDLTVWMEHFESCPAKMPIVVRSESKTLAAVLMMAMMYDRAIHVCALSRREEIMVVREAKRRGAKVTCGVSPTHLFLTDEDVDKRGEDLMSIRPRLATAKDRQALWDNIDIIDVFSSHHAPHTKEEKKNQKLPGFPGLETMLPLLLTAVNDGRLTIEDLVLRLHTNPRKIFGLPEQPDTYVEVDLDRNWVLPEKMPHGKCDWNPFEGITVSGAVSRVVLRGELVYLDGQVLADPGNGKEMKSDGSFWETEQGSAGRKPTLRFTENAGGLERPRPDVHARDMSPPRRELEKSPQRRLVAARPGAVSIHPGAASGELDPASPKAPAYIDHVAAHPQHRPALGHKSPNMVAPGLDQHQGLSTSSKLADWRGQSVLSVTQFNRSFLHQLFNLAHDLRIFSQRGPLDILRGMSLASVFYEPSTRTSCSFTAAMQKLGGTVINLSDMGSTAVAKGESLQDFMRVMERYSDIVVLRHPEKGAVQNVQRFMRKPIINAGDGTGEHPTQALLDVYTIREEIGTVNGLTVAMVGDLKHGRTVHSLVQLLSLYDVKIRLVAPAGLEMPKEYVDLAKSKGIDVTQHDHINQVIAEADVVYVTRTQKERFSDPAAAEAAKSSYVITAQTLTKAKQHMILMHPLPRVDEIHEECDLDPRSVYFRQAEHGMYVRMALLAVIAGKA